MKKARDSVQICLLDRWVQDLCDVLISIVYYEFSVPDNAWRVNGGVWSVTREYP